MNARKALISVLCIGLVAMTAGAGTFAYFSDTETSTGNTFTVGTMDLKIKDGNAYWSDGITEAEWELTDMKPGTEVYGSICFINSGSIEADHLGITCDYTIDENGCLESETNCTNDADDMAYYMEITVLTYYYTIPTPSTMDGIPGINDDNGNGYKDLQDLKTSGLDNLPPVGDLGLEKIDMLIKFHETAGNDFQGDTFDLTMIFKLDQDSSQ